MSFTEGAMLLISIAIFGYLAYALFRGERL
jgi:K+-transporting ATPase KdpF subunit